MRVLKGRVVSGLGNFSYWMEKLEEHYYIKTGVHLHPGTLNLESDQPYNIAKSAIRLEKEEYEGAVSVNIVECKVFGRKAFLLRTDNNESGQGHHPKTIIEIACEVKLREEYSLKDGDMVEVEVFV